MKSHSVEKFIFFFSIVSLIVFVISIPVLFAFENRFLVTDWASRVFYTYGGIAPLVIAIIVWKRKKRGYNDPLSIEAMRTAKKELPKRIYKFCSLSPGNDADLDKKKIYSLKNKKIWMSDCSSLNDPYEGMYAYIDEQLDKKEDRGSQDIINQLTSSRDMYIQASFSCNFDSILMWGHYANGCRGYCIEYTVKSDHHLFAVQYVSKRPLLSYGTYSREVANNLLKVRKALDKVADEQEFIAYVLYIQALKDRSWSYEKEVRLIELSCAEPNSKCGNVNGEDYGLEISRLFIGCHCKYKKELIDVAKVLDIPVSIMGIQLDSNKYQLVEKSITDSCFE